MWGNCLTSWRSIRTIPEWTVCISNMQKLITVTINCWHLVAQRKFPSIQNPRPSMYQLTLHTYKLLAGHRHSVQLSPCLYNRITLLAWTSILFRGALKAGGDACTHPPKYKFKKHRFFNTSRYETSKWFALAEFHHVTYWSPGNWNFDKIYLTTWLALDEIT
jgi:hypothetical protein